MVNAKTEKYKPFYKKKYEAMFSEGKHEIFDKL
jgi:hypothetical protein